MIAGGMDNMSMNRKEEIVLITLELAAQKGLANVSMSMIADKIGIKKPSLYKHFASKEEIVEAMYEYLRRQAKEKANIKSLILHRQAMTLAHSLQEKRYMKFCSLWYVDIFR